MLVFCCLSNDTVSTAVKSYFPQFHCKEFFSGGYFKKWTLSISTLFNPGWPLLWPLILYPFQMLFRSITMNKISGGDGIPVELFQILKDNAVKALHSICQQIWKTQQWPQDWKRSVFMPIPKKGNAKECSNYSTIVLISHTSKVMLKILQASLPTVCELWTSRCSSWI